MGIFIKCAIIAITAAISATMLKKHVPEISVMLLIIAGVIILSFISGLLTQVVDFIKILADDAGISNDLLAPVFKVTGIAILSKFASDICRDAGAGALVTAVELSSSVIAIILSMPLFNSVIGLITGM